MKIMIAAKFLLRYAPMLASLLPRVTSISRGSWIKLGLGLLAAAVTSGIVAVLLFVWLLQLLLDLVANSSLWQSLASLL